MNLREIKRASNRMKLSREERNAIKLDNLQRCYDIVEAHENGKIDHWTSYYMVHSLKEILKYGRELYRDEKYNAITSKLLAEIAGNLSLTSVFYVQRGVPRYLFDLNTYSDYLSDQFINNFEEAIADHKDSVRNYHIQEIPLYMKILQHYHMDEMFSEDVLQHYLNYINNVDDFSYSLSWFFITDDTTPEIDEKIINSIIDGNNIIDFIQYCNNIFGGGLPIDAYGTDMLDYNGLHYHMNKGVDVYSRIMRTIPVDNQLGYAI